jgi:molecular chaperone GrpE
MDKASRQELVERFRVYLDQVHPDAPSVPEAEEQAPETDLYSLFTELVGLKNEVRIEARQVKAALEQFKTLFEALQSANASLSSELERCRSERRDAVYEGVRPLLLEILELRDRLEAGLRAARAHRPSLLSRWCRTETRLIAGTREGQEITLRRVDQLLAAHRVLPLEAVGRPLDPHTMRVAEVERRGDIANGVVTEELRKGYTMDGRLLRTAEVRVNRVGEG